MQNRLLLAAGHAPAFPERSLDDPDLAPVRDALDVILSGHEPYPAVAVDRVWNLIAANSAMLALTESVDIDPALLEPPINVMRVGLHPCGLGPLFVNLGDWQAHWLKRLERQLSFFGMFASFDTPFEVTTSELAIEFLFPADRATAETLHEPGAGPS
ncbi:MAG: hypothetical protein WA687_14655 [Solirubrobacterales bacterium]